MGTMGAISSIRQVYSGAVVKCSPWTSSIGIPLEFLTRQRLRTYPRPTETLSVGSINLCFNKPSTFSGHLIHMNDEASLPELLLQLVRVRAENHHF